jgi:hypothetical protein
VEAIEDNWMRRGSPERASDSDEDDGGEDDGGGEDKRSPSLNFGRWSPTYHEEACRSNNGAGGRWSEEGAVGEWCFPASLAGGLGQKLVLDEEVKTAVQIPSLDNNGEQWWWPAMVSRGVGGKSKQSGREGVRRRNGGGFPLPAHARGDKLPPTWGGA